MTRHTLPLVVARLAAVMAGAFGALSSCAGTPSIGMQPVFEALLNNTGYRAWPLPESVRTRPGMLVSNDEHQRIERRALGPCFIENPRGDFTGSSTTVANAGVNLEVLKSLGIGLSGQWAQRVRYRVVEAVSYDLVAGELRRLFAALPESERRAYLAQQAELVTYDSVLGARALEIELVDEQGMALDLSSPAIASALNLTANFVGERKNEQTLVYKGPVGGVYFGYRLIALGDLMLETGATSAAPPLSAKFLLRSHAPGSARQDIFVREGSALESGDRLQARIEPAEPCFAYLFLHDSQGALIPLFASGPNDALASGLAQVLPGESDYWILDDHPGWETFMLVLSRQPESNLDGLARQLRAGMAGDGAWGHRPFASGSQPPVAAVQGYRARGLATETLQGAAVGVAATPREIALQGRGDLVYHQISFFHRPR